MVRFDSNRLFRGRGGALLAIIVLAAVAYAAASLDKPLPPVVGQARASDGDSFRVGDQRIRLIDLDAPELAQTCTDAAGQSWPCGVVARDRMARLLAAGPVDCAADDHDQYGRVLAICTVAGTDIAEVMVAEGLAISSGSYWREEQSAKSGKLGIWAGSFELPHDYREAHPTSRHFLQLP